MMRLQMKFLAFAAACFMLDACTTVYSVPAGICKEMNQLSLWFHGGMKDNTISFIIFEDACFIFIVLMSHFVEKIHKVDRWLERLLEKLGRKEHNSDEAIVLTQKAVYVMLFCAVGLRLLCGISGLFNIVSFWLAVG